MNEFPNESLRTQGQEATHHDFRNQSPGYPGTICNPVPARSFTPLLLKKYCTMDFCHSKGFCVKFNDFHIETLRTQCQIVDLSRRLLDPVFLALGMNKDTLEPSLSFRIPMTTPKHSSPIKVNVIFAKNGVRKE